VNFKTWTFCGFRGSNGGEEREQQQNHYQVFQVVGQLARQPPLVRNDRAQGEGAEDSRMPMLVGSQRREQQPHEHRGHLLLQRARAVEEGQPHNRRTHKDPLWWSHSFAELLRSASGGVGQLVEKHLSIIDAAS
jgi:hypothetical protein